MACFSLFYIIKKTVMQLVSKMVHLNVCVGGGVFVNYLLIINKDFKARVCSFIKPNNSTEACFESLRSHRNISI